MSQGRYSNPFKAIWNGIVEARQQTYEKIIPLDPKVNVYGKTCLVTGANSGLGFAIATQLAERGGKVILACRSGIPETGEQIKELSHSSSVEMLKIDLSDLHTVNQFCDILKKRGEKIDIFISNAAMVANQSRKSKQGLEEMFQVNYLAKFYLINRLLKDGTIPKQSFSGKTQIPRIIIVSSESHRSPKAIDWDSFGEYQSYGIAQSMHQYGYSKLLLSTFASELARRLRSQDKIDAAVHAFCPGPVNTNIARESPAAFRPLLKLIFTAFFKSPKKAATPALYLAASPDIEGKTGEYLHILNKKTMDTKALDPENGRMLWKKTEELLKKLGF